MENKGTEYRMKYNMSDLLNVDKRYVKDDIIRSKIKIEADQPNKLYRRIPKFRYI